MPACLPAGSGCLIPAPRENLGGQGLAMSLRLECLDSQFLAAFGWEEKLQWLSRSGWGKEMIIGTPGGFLFCKQPWLPLKRLLFM